MSVRYLFDLALQVSELQVLLQVCVCVVSDLLQFLLFVLQEALQLLHLRRQASLRLGQLHTCSTRRTLETTRTSCLILHARTDVCVSMANSIRRFPWGSAVCFREQFP